MSPNARRALAIVLWTASIAAAAEGPESRAQRIAAYFHRPSAEVRSLREEGYSYREIIKILVMVRASGLEPEALLRKNREGLPWESVAAGLKLDARQFRRESERARSEIEKRETPAPIEPPSPVPTVPLPPPITEPARPAMPLARPALPPIPASGQSLTTLVRAFNAFSRQLFLILLKEQPGENLVVMPASIMTTLSALSGVGAGNTQAAMSRALGLDDLSETQISGLSRLLLSSLKEIEAPGLFWQDASLWFPETFETPAEPLARLHSFFGLTAYRLGSSLHITTLRVTEWLRAHDREDGPTVMLWQEQNPSLAVLQAGHCVARVGRSFDLSQTKDSEFYLPTGHIRLVKQMSSSGPFFYQETDGIQRLQMRLEPDRLMLSIFLDQRDLGLERLNAWLARQDGAQWLEPGPLQAGRVRLPRLELNSPVDLEPALKEAGLESLFSEGRRFTGLTKRMDDLYVSQWVQGVSFRLDERRPPEKRAAPAAVEVAETRPFTLDASRPFILVIHDLKTGAIVLIAAVQQPPPAVSY